MFAAVPDAFDVDGVGEVPDFFGGVDGVCGWSVTLACSSIVRRGGER